MRYFLGRSLYLQRRVRRARRAQRGAGVAEGVVRRVLEDVVVEELLELLPVPAGSGARKIGSSLRRGLRGAFQGVLGSSWCI